MRASWVRSSPVGTGGGPAAVFPRAASPAAAGPSASATARRRPRDLAEPAGKKRPLQTEGSVRYLCFFLLRVEGRRSLFLFYLKSSLPFFPAHVYCKTCTVASKRH